MAIRFVGKRSFEHPNDAIEYLEYEVGRGYVVTEEDLYNLKCLTEEWYDSTKEELQEDMISSDDHDEALVNERSIAFDDACEAVQSIGKMRQDTKNRIIEALRERERK